MRVGVESPVRCCRVDSSCTAKEDLEAAKMETEPASCEDWACDGVCGSGSHTDSRNASFSSMPVAGRRKEEGTDGTVEREGWGFVERTGDCEGGGDLAEEERIELTRESKSGFSRCWDRSK